MDLRPTRYAILGLEEAQMKHKVITKGARTATRIGGHLGRREKAATWRAYRSRVRTQMTSLQPDDWNLEPTSKTRWTAWDTI